MMMTKDYYRILEVHPEASPEVIKTAKKVLLSAYHPDHNPDRSKWAHRKTQEILEAYAVLSDSRRRTEYDRVHKKMQEYKKKGKRLTALEDENQNSEAMIFCPHCGKKNRMRQEINLTSAKCGNCGGRLLVRSRFRSKLKAEGQLWKEAFQALRNVFHLRSRKVRDMFRAGGEDSDGH